MGAHGWTLLPDQRGALIHRINPDSAGHVLCGRPVDPHAAVHDHNPGFDPCRECAALAGEGGFRSTARITRLPRRPAPSIGGHAEQAPEQADGEERVGWVRLPGQLLHRPDPVARERVACGMALPVGVKVWMRPPVDWPPCPACAANLPARLAKARKQGLRDMPRLDKAGRQAASRKPARKRAPLTGEDLRRAWRRLGWVVLADKRRSHRPHPERPSQVLCGRRLDPGVDVLRDQPELRPCQRCADILRRRQENLGLRRIVIASPTDVDRYDRARGGSSIRTVSGGLPTLGRHR